MNSLTRYGLLAAAGIATVTATAGADAAREPSGRSAIPIEAALASFDFVDLGVAGVGVGDYFVQTDTLTIDGESVGTDVVHCTATGDETKPGRCDAVLTFEDGTIIAAGSIPNFDPTDGAPFRFAITGGTHRYKRARGDIAVTESASGYVATIYIQP